MSMRHGEKARFFLKPEYGYGPKTSTPFVQTHGSALVFDIELMAFTKVKSGHELTLAEKVNVAEELKSTGNTRFASMQFDWARNTYVKALDFLDVLDHAEDPMREGADLLKAALHRNSAAALLKLKRYAQAVEACNDALKLDPDDKKACASKGQVKSIT